MSGPKDDNKKGKKKGGKSDKKADEESKEEVLENEESLINERKTTVVIHYEADQNNIRYITNILKNAGILADVKSGIDSEEIEITIEKSDLNKTKQTLSKNGFELQEY